MFLIRDGALPAEISEFAEVTVTRVEPELYVLPLPLRGGEPRSVRAADDPRRMGQLRSRLDNDASRAAPTAGR